MRRLMAKLARLAALLALCLAVMGAVWLFAAGSMLTRADAPEPSDAIVLLSGGYLRTRQAADLYNQGFAPAVYVSRTRHDSEKTRVLALAGVDMPRQEEIHRRLLVHYGVPESAVRFYGQGVISTAEEARSLARALPPDSRLIVVTSPYHALRAGLIFRDAFPHGRVLMVPTTYEHFRKNWWTDQNSAKAVVMETAKLTWYLLGGVFTSANDPADGPADAGAQ